MNVDEIGQAMHLSQPAISYHLKLLSSTGLITVQRHGTHRLYRLAETRNSALEKLRDLIDTIQACTGEAA